MTAAWSGDSGQGSGARGEGIGRAPLTPDSCPPTPEVDDPRMVHAVQEYLRAIEAGHRPNRQEFLTRHPAIAGHRRQNELLGRHHGNGGEQP